MSDTQKYNNEKRIKLVWKGILVHKLGLILHKSKYYERIDE